MSSPSCTRDRNRVAHVYADVFIDPVAARKIVTKFIGIMLFENDVWLMEEPAH